MSRYPQRRSISYLFDSLFADSSRGDAPWNTHLLTMSKQRMQFFSSLWHQVPIRFLLNSRRCLHQFLSIYPSGLSASSTVCCLWHLLHSSELYLVFCLSSTLSPLSPLSDIRKSHFLLQIYVAIDAASRPKMHSICLPSSGAVSLLIDQLSHPQFRP